MKTSFMVTRLQLLKINIWYGLSFGTTGPVAYPRFHMAEIGALACIMGYRSIQLFGSIQLKISVAVAIQLAVAGDAYIFGILRKEHAQMDVLVWRIGCVGCIIIQIRAAAQYGAFLQVQIYIAFEVRGANDKHPGWHYHIAAAVGIAIVNRRLQGFGAQLV